MPHLTLAPSPGHRSTPLGTITVPPCASPELTLCNACSMTHCFQGTILPSGYPGQTRKQSLAAHPLLCRHVRARLELKASAVQPAPTAPACSVRSQVLSGLEMTDDCGLRTSGERSRWGRVGEGAEVSSAGLSHAPKFNVLSWGVTRKLPEEEEEESSGATARL